MSEKKPDVFGNKPTPEQIKEANDNGIKIAEQLNKENEVKPMNFPTEGEKAAAEEMWRRTQEQIRLREETLKKNIEISNELDNARANKLTEKPNYEVKKEVNNQSYTLKNMENNNIIQELSYPQMNQPFDVITLPSEGKLYKNKKKNVKVAYLTTADENILTSPNLIESGDFLEILINRKLLEPDLRYKDLLPGDRDAIMIWLRATGYGELYPILVFNKNNEQFETEFNLSELKMVNLSVEPDNDGLFSFMLPLSKEHIKFKLLTVGEIEALESIFEQNKDSKINETNTLLLENQIVEVSGNRDKGFIKDFVQNMRVMDGKKLKEYINKIECGVDMNIEVKAPGGESIKTFLPITSKFFWPDFEI